MGRTAPSTGRPPAAFRKQQRAKRAKETLNKVIPAILASNDRSRRGVLAAELISDSSLNQKQSAGTHRVEQSEHGRKGKGRSKKIDRDIDLGESERAEDGHPVPASGETQPPTIKIIVSDTLTAAAILNKSRCATASAKKASRAPNVAILNMASLLRPGGGFTSGATSQEEFLCMRTTLLPSLHEEFYRLPEVGSVWTPDVLVFRDSTAEAKDLPSQDRFFVDVVTTGMIRFPNVITRTTYKDDEGAVTDQLKEEQVYASAADARLVRSKMMAVMGVLQSKGCKKVVLGAWGCGAYGNPVGEIARAWKETLTGKGDTGLASRSSGASSISKGWFGLTDMVFAISQGKMAAEFARAWGDDITVEGNVPNDIVEDSDEDEEEGDSAQVELRDLQIKIEQLQVQVDSARTPILRTGLEAVLGKLLAEQHSKTGQVAGDQDS